ncbi:MAG TPA: universal stress protein [Acidimicrobiales bacterium]|nr:universal stress protein [Acidimicrobiales bacterium]
MFEKILVALDDSGHAEKTLLTAAGLAKLAGSEVEVLHVRESHFIGRAGAVPDEESVEAQKIVDAALKVLSDTGVHATGKLRGALHGRVAREILDEASEVGASMIVMGSHGTGDLEGVLLGSTTHKVLHLGHLPVFVVR